MASRNLSVQLLTYLHLLKNTWPFLQPQKKAGSHCCIYLFIVLRTLAVFLLGWVVSGRVAYSVFGVKVRLYIVFLCHCLFTKQTFAFPSLITCIYWTVTEFHRIQHTVDHFFISKTILLLC